MTFGVAVVIVLIADGATLYVRHNDAKPVSVNDAVAKYRSDTHRTPTPAPSPTRDTAAPKPPTPTPTPTSVATTTVPVAPPPGTTPPTTATRSPSGASSPSHRSHPTQQPTATPTPTASPLTLPPPGVYSYTTTGSESIGVPGGSRSYPKTSTITVENAGCGVKEDWQPNNQHSETKRLCLHHGVVRLAGFSTRVAFFGVGSTQTYTCGRDAVVYSPDMAVGQSSTFSCSSTDSTARQTVTPRGFTRLTVNGTSVRVLHVTVASMLTGANHGTSQQELWLSTDHSVLVKNTGRIDATQRGVNYHERYTLQLQHLTPQE
jgi:hypothetical protein